MRTKGRDSSPKSRSIWLVVNSDTSKNSLGMFFAHFACLHAVSHSNFCSVASEQTSKLGWSRGTYVDTYAPALAKTVSIYFII